MLHLKTNSRDSLLKLRQFYSPRFASVSSAANEYQHCTTVPGTLIDRVVSIGESPLKCVFRKSGHKVSILKDGIDGHADSIRLLLNSRNYLNHNSEEHFMVRLLTTAM